MDIFRYTPVPNSPFLHTNAEMVDGYREVEWIERYREPSEFKIKGMATDGLQKKLPIGSFISHTRSNELFLVEDHYIDDNDVPEITISGRSFEAWLDNRIIGTEVAHPAGEEQTDFVIGDEWYTWEQAVLLLIQHLLECYDNRNQLPYLQIIDTVTGTAPKQEATWPRVGLHSGLMTLLEVDNLGIKCLRPGVPGGGPNPAWSTLLVHRGVDRSGTVVFSYNSGDILGAEYLNSSKPRRNVCIVTSKWFEVVVDQSNNASALNRLIMNIEAKDIDERYTVEPVSGATRTALQNRMASRGRMALGKRKAISLQNIRTSPAAKVFKYGIHYDLGDIVMVRGNYGNVQKMRVTEYVEINGENGVEAYPTLEELEET
jgi:hypothetical protein